jgi:hypothetical protein
VWLDSNSLVVPCPSPATHTNPPLIWLRPAPDFIQFQPDEQLRGNPRNLRFSKFDNTPYVVPYNSI